MQEKMDTKEQQNKKRNRRLTVITIIVLLVIIILLLLRGCVSTDNPPIGGNTTPSFNTSVDPNATSEKHGQTSEEVERLLNEKVAEGMITIGINPNPIFDTAGSKGNILIENDAANRYPQIVEIYLVETNELLYKSGLIPIGQSVPECTLDKSLTVGEHKAIAYFNAVDEATGNAAGKAAANITITITK